MSRVDADSELGAGAGLLTGRPTQGPFTRPGLLHRMVALVPVGLLTQWLRASRVSVPADTVEASFYGPASEAPEDQFCCALLDRAVVSLLGLKTRDPGPQEQIVRSCCGSARGVGGCCGHL